MAGTESDEENQGWRWILTGLIVLALVAAGGYGLYRLLGGNVHAPRRPPKISLLPDRPPPPPPPETKKPEPPKENQKEIKTEQVKVPTPQPDNEPLKMEGAAGEGGSPFAAGTVSKEYIGGPVGIGGGMQFAFYTNLLQRHLQEELNRDRKLRASDYRVTVRVWLARDGSVQRAELAQSTGSDSLDSLLRRALTQVKALGEAPPEDMPQPVRLRITARGAG